MNRSGRFYVHENESCLGRCRSQDRCDGESREAKQLARQRLRFVCDGWPSGDEVAAGLAAALSEILTA